MTGQQTAHEAALELLDGARYLVVCHPDSLTDEMAELLLRCPAYRLRESEHVERGRAYIIDAAMILSLRGLTDRLGAWLEEARATA